MRCLYTSLMTAAAAAMGVAATPAGAADLYVPELAAPVYEMTWAGPYIGVLGGYAFGDAEFQEEDEEGDPSPPVNFGLSGGLAGGYAGWNLQSGKLVYGLELDGTWLSDFDDAVVTGNGNVSREFGLEWIASARGRLGWVFSDRLMAYLTAGVAGAEVHTSFSNPAGTTSNKDIEVGWAAGVGADFVLFQSMPNLLGRFEYLYADLDLEDVSTNSGFDEGDMKFEGLHMLRAGLSLKF